MRSTRLLTISIRHNSFFRRSDSYCSRVSVLVTIILWCGVHAYFTFCVLVECWDTIKNTYPTEIVENAVSNRISTKSSNVGRTVYTVCFSYYYFYYYYDFCIADGHWMGTSISLSWRGRMVVLLMVVEIQYSRLPKIPADVECRNRAFRWQNKMVPSEVFVSYLFSLSHSLSLYLSLFLSLSPLLPTHRLLLSRLGKARGCVYILFIYYVYARMKRTLCTSAGLHTDNKRSPPFFQLKGLEKARISYSYTC
jgi:hypothetical protein